METPVSDDVKILRELTSALTFGPDMINQERYKISVVHGTGKIEAYGILKELGKDGIGLARCIAYVGATMESHKHAEIEIFIIQSGVYEITVSDEVHILKKGDVLRIDPNIVHSTHCPGPENCKHIAVTIPASKFFPEGVLDGQYGF